MICSEKEITGVYKKGKQVNYMQLLNAGDKSLLKKMPVKLMIAFRD